VGEVVKVSVRVFLDTLDGLPATPTMHEAKGCALLGWRSASSVRAVDLADAAFLGELARGWPGDQQVLGG
jgi:hypothetical protein